MELEFLVIKCGVPLFYYNSNNSVDNSMFASFISAIQDFSEVMNGEGINKMDMYSKRIYFKKNNELSVLYALISDDKPKNCEKELDNAINGFEGLYLDKIKTWAGDISTFNEFNKFFSKRTVDLFQESFW